MKEKMKFMKGIKRMLAMVLTFAMALTLMPSRSIIVKAADNGNFSNLQSLINGASTTLTLSKDYVAESTEESLVIEKAITINLNGHTIDRNLSAAQDNGYVINIKSGGTLTITDSSVGANGKITGGYTKTTATAGGVLVQNGGALVMNGGYITGNRGEGSGSGGVYVRNGATFTMKGGFITENTADREGGAVNNYYGTSIMQGGTIKNNAAQTGAGVFNYNGTFKMSGGSITNNNASYKGGGVYVSASATTIFGGTAVVSNNTSGYSGTTKDNVFLVTVYNSALPTAIFSIGTGSNGVSVPSSTMKIGVNTERKPNATTAYQITEANSNVSNYLDYFTSDIDGCKVGIKTATPADNKLYLYADSDNNYTMHPHVGYTALTTANASTYRDSYSSNNGMKKGKYYLNSDVINIETHAGCTQSWYQYDKSGTYTICLNGNTLESPNTYSAYYVGDGAKSILENCKASGEIKSSGYAIEVSANATLDIKNNIKVTSTGSYGIMLYPGSKITIPEKITFDTGYEANFYINYNYGLDNKAKIVLSEPLKNTTPYTMDFMDYSNNVQNLSPDAPFVFTQGWTEIMKDANPDRYFKPVNANYKIVKVDGELAIKYVAPPSISVSLNESPTTITYGEAASDVEVATVVPANFETDPTSFTTSWYSVLSGGTVLGSGVKTPTAVVNSTTKSVTVSTTADVPAGTYYLSVKSGSVVASERIPVVVNKATIADNFKTATGTLLATNEKTVEVSLPELPEGASYGSASNSYTDFFTVGTVSDGKITVTSVKDWDKNTEASGKTFTIPVTGASNYNDYTVEVTITPVFHTHNFTYTSDGNKIEAYCKNENCPSGTDATHKVSLTLSASSANYSGSAVEATMDKTAWEAAGLTAPTIVYEAKTGSALTDGKAVNAGSYTAKITVADKTATKDFEITKASQEVPAIGVGYTINYTDETITAGTDYEVSTSNTSFVAPTDGKVVPGNTYYVRKKGNDNYNPSSWTSITVAARPTAPSGYTAVDPTTVGGANGKITGVTTAMEYSTNNGTSWTAVSGTEITGLSSGKVLLRVKATSSAFASTNVEITLSNPHVHAIDVTKKHVAVPSTCKTKGTKEWYECTDSSCDKKLDKNGNELTSIELDFDSSNHTYATTYNKDVTGHWYTATCGHNVQGSFSVHAYGDWTVTKLATITEAGEKQRTCSVCGYKETVATTYDKPVGDTDVDPNAGKIENKTDSSKNGCAANVEVTKSEIIEKLELTPEELSRVENGEDIAFDLEVTTEESNNISQSEQKEAEKKLESGEKIGQYLDINLFKIVGNDKSKVSQTNGKIKIQIKLPEEIKKAGTDYFIIRVHEGVATKLDLTLVSGDTYSFETDQFSTYAIGYKDSTPTAAPEETKSEETKPASPKTGDTTNMYQWILLMVAGLGVCALKYSKKRKEN